MKTDETWKSDCEELSQDIRAFTEWFSEKYSEVMRDTKLTTSQYRTLSVLAEGKICIEADIATSLDRDSGRVSKALKALMKAGLVSRTPKEGDKRRFLWQSTEAGRSKVRDVQEDLVYVVGRCLASGGKRRRNTTLKVFRDLIGDSRQMNLAECGKEQEFGSRAPGRRKQRREEAKARKDAETGGRKEGAGKGSHKPRKSLHHRIRNEGETQFS
jgi:DNA-binding MarR family transcriptional regulator